jgi:cell division protein FtsQ
MFSRFMFFVTLASITVLCAGVWRVLDRPVRGFVIEGDLTKMERAELQRTLADQPVKGVLSTSLTEIASHVEQLPWTRQINVRRQWPDQLIVTMSIASPVVRWGEDLYLSAYGDLLALPDHYPGLPEFDVAIATPQQAMQVYRLLVQIAAREQLNIARLEQNEQGQWAINLSKGPRVLLGAEQLNERMHHFLLVHRRVLAEDTREVEYVDARYGNGVAVKFVDETTLQADAMMVAQNDKTTFSKGNE